MTEHRGIVALEGALAEVEHDISSLDRRISEGRIKIESHKARLELLYKDRDNLTAALAMVRKRVAS